MRKYLMLVATFVSLLCSCTNYKHIDVNDVKLEKFKLISTSKADLQLQVSVNNPSKTIFTITDIQGVLYRDDVPFANLSLLEEIVIPPQAVTDVHVKCRINLLDPLAVLVMGLDMSSWNEDEFTVDIKTTVKGGGLKKSFRLKKVPLSKVIKRIKIK